MSDSIMVALITGAISLIGTIITVLMANKQTLINVEKNLTAHQNAIELDLKTHQAVTDTKIEELTREVREHNNFARRVPVIEEQIENIEKRLNQKVS